MNFLIKKKKKKKIETWKVDVYSPYEELKTDRLKFESSNVGEYTFKVIWQFKKKIDKNFKKTTDLSKKELPPLFFDRPNTYFYYDHNEHFKPFQFKLGQFWNNTSEPRRNDWSDQDFNNFVFIYLDTALYDATKPSYVFGLTNATNTVIISCDLSKWTCTIERYGIIHVMKYNYDQRKTNF